MYVVRLQKKKKAEYEGKYQLCHQSLETVEYKPKNYAEKKMK